MLKPLETEFKGRKISLECTHKRAFPPPQMYGSTPEDIDNLWRQGRVDQSQYQHLKTWHENCGLMIMGPKCLDCPLALKRNPRPGRPNVIETEPWLAVKEQMHWDDMAARKPPLEERVAAAESVAVAAKGFVKHGTPVPTGVVAPKAQEPEDAEEPEEPDAQEPEEPEAQEPEDPDEPSVADVLAAGNTGVTTVDMTPERTPEAAPKKASKKRTSKKKKAAPSEPLPDDPSNTEPDGEPLADGPDLDDESFLDALADD